MGEGCKLCPQAAFVPQSVYATPYFSVRIRRINFHIFFHAQQGRQEAPARKESAIGTRTVGARLAALGDLLPACWPAAGGTAWTVGTVSGNFDI